MAEHNDYLYDVFISYPHEEHHKVWVNDIFLPLFKLHLRQELGREPIIFLDKEQIKNGDSWKIKLKNSLAYSRIMIPIWSIDYFQSEWCVGECAVMHHREFQLGFRKGTNSSGLILPIRLFDFNNYPQFAKDIQHFNCTSYNLTADYFKKSEGFMNLERDIQRWLPEVADVIVKVPDWNSEWKTENWIDIPFDTAKTNPKFNPSVISFHPPTLV